MNDTIEKQSELQKPKKKRTSWRVFKHVIFLLLVCIVAGYIYSVLTWKSESQKNSEEIIREEAAKILNKDSNILSNNDFKKITKFYLTDKVISDIKPIEKFTNLQDFRLSSISLPQYIYTPRRKNIPKWNKFLINIGINKAPERKYLDLSPLGKLTNLQEISLSLVPTNDIKPLANLSNLKRLRLFCTNVSDIEPLRNLINLQELNLNVTDKTDFKLLKGLKNLQKLELYGTDVIDEQIEDLQKSLPNTTIKYYKIGVVDNSW